MEPKVRASLGCQLARLGRALVIQLIVSGIALAEPSNYADGLITQGSLRTRFESVDWFGNSIGSKAYTFESVKGQLGVGINRELYSAFVQGQFSGIYELPEGAGGVGGNYRTLNSDHSSADAVRVRQVYLTMQDRASKPNLTATVGRFLYSSGDEAPAKSADLKWLQSKRVAQRMIGPFDYSFGRSFDGFRADYSLNTDDSLTGFYSHPTEGGFMVDGGDTINKVSLSTLVYSHQSATNASQLFLYGYSDGRGILKTDSRPLSSREKDRQDIELLTLGGSSVRCATFGDYSVDGVIWGAMQTGHWGQLVQDSYAAAVEFGIHFNSIGSKPAIRAGYSQSSGDANSADGRHSTFFQMEPTARLYAATPFFNLENNKDLFIQGTITPFTSLAIKAEVHRIQLSEAKDLLYSGAGAIEKSDRFGYAGVSLLGSSNVGTLTDLEVTYQLAQSVQLLGYYGYLRGESGLEDAFQNGQSDVHYGFIEVSLKL